MYGFLSYTGFTRRNTLFIFLWLRHRNIVTHHTQHISKAAVVNDSEAIVKCIISRNQKAYYCTHSRTGAAYAASGAWRA